MAIKRRHLARQVVGWSDRPQRLRQARSRGAIDRGTTWIKDAVCEADIVVLALPVSTIWGLAPTVSIVMRPGAVLTDVGSSKGLIIRKVERRLQRLQRRLGKSVRFIGAHPLAGSEQRGILAARGDLFEQSICILTRTTQTDLRALASVRRLWEGVGSRVRVMDPIRHDALLAATSHMPHLLAWCLVAASAREAQVVMAPSFLEMTRIAKSDPELWYDILLSNRTAILAAMRRFGKCWNTLHRAIATDDGSLWPLLRRAQSLRHALEDRS